MVFQMINKVDKRCIDGLCGAGVVLTIHRL